MAKISISMSDKMEKFVADRVESGDFNNTSEYFRDLVRRDQEKREAEDKLRTIIRRSLKSGIGKRSPEEIWAEGEKRHANKRGRGA
jgi:antitoxin ParD1/3/4